MAGSGFNTDENRRVAPLRSLEGSGKFEAVRRKDTVVVVANPTEDPVTETISPRDGLLQDDSAMRDLVGGDTVRIYAGLMTVTVPPKTVRAYAPVMVDGPGYDRYKRVP